MPSRLRSSAGVFAVAVVCGAGCGPEPSRGAERSGSASSAIQGGTNDTTHDFALAFCGGAPGGPMSGANCLFICGGTLIAPNLALTARHCVDTVSDPTITCSGNAFGMPLYPASQIFVTANPDMRSASAVWFPVAEVVTPPQKEFCSNDLALLILGENVPKSAVRTPATPELWYPPYSKQYSGNLTVLGYGLDAPNDASSWGTRRILDGLSVLCVPGNPDRAHACPPASASGIGEYEFEAGNGLCEGDSGSGAFDERAFQEGRFLSLGVLSRGGTTGYQCTGSVYTQLYPWQDLIAKTAKRAAAKGGYPVPAWATPPASTDGGPPPPPPEEAGADDGGEDAGDGGVLPPGARCTSGESCAPGACVSASVDAGTVCADPCSDAGACARGFGCVKGYCFAGADAGMGGTDNGSGCDVGSSSRHGHVGVLILVGFAAVASRRRRRI